MDTFWYGIFGGLAVNILRLIELIHLPLEQRPATFTDPLYIVQFVSLPLMGGVLAYAYQASGTALSPILAINIGASAPLILKSFASAAHPIGPRKID